MLHSSSTLAFSPSGPDALCTFSLSNSLVKPLGSTVMSSMGENGLAPLEGESESPLHLKADWNCLLHILTFCFIYVLRNPYYPKLVLF